MSDPIRAPAPFLAPEIISRILHFVHPKQINWSKEGEEHCSFAKIARIDSGWTTEAQKRLYEAIQVRTSTKLDQLLGVAHKFGHCILSLGFANDSRISYPPRVLQQLFQLLETAINLKYFEYDTPMNPSTRNPLNMISPADWIGISSKRNLFLPNLVTLKVNPGRSEDWDRVHVDCFIAAAPNLVRLDIAAYEDNYEGEMWESKIPSTLKELYLCSAPAVMQGRLWPVSSFIGLEVLEMQSVEWERDDRIELITSTLPFFEAIGPSLVSLDVWETIFPLELLAPLTKLEIIKKLQVDETNPSEYLSCLPPSIVHLDISADFLPSTITIADFSNLVHLEQVEFQGIFDYAIFPPLKVLINTNPWASNVLETLEALTAETVTFQELRLGSGTDVEYRKMDYDSDDNLVSFSSSDLTKNPKIKQRCRELGITLTRAGHYTD